MGAGGLEIDGVRFAVGGPGISPGNIGTVLNGSIGPVATIGSTKASNIPSGAIVGSNVSSTSGNLVMFGLGSIGGGNTTVPSGSRIPMRFPSESYTGPAAGPVGGVTCRSVGSRVSSNVLSEVTMMAAESSGGSTNGSALVIAVAFKTTRGSRCSKNIRLRRCRCYLRILFRPANRVAGMFFLLPGACAETQCYENPTLRTGRSVIRFRLD